MNKLVHNRLILISLTCILFLSGCSNKMEKSEVAGLLGTDKLPSEAVYPEYMVDMSILENVIGDADHVFVGCVKEYIETVYDVQGDEDFPRTVYSVEVIENIKGNLIQNQNIELRKSGGIDKKGEKFYIYENDILPKVGEYYVFSVYALPSGGLYASGYNTSVLIEKKDDYKNDTKYSEFINAYKNEVTTDRKRFQSKYDKNYT